MPDQLPRPDHVRIRCAETKRLIATITTEGISVWCKYTKTSERLPWEMIEAARKQAQEAQAAQAHLGQGRQEKAQAEAC